MDQSTNTVFISHSHGLATLLHPPCVQSLPSAGSLLFDPLFQHQDDFCGSALYKCSTHCHTAIFKMMESPGLPLQYVNIIAYCMIFTVVSYE